ncbi:MAG: hypothetical protein OEX12_11385 [Gammaproteobacteria bacterium]|nr:hypothetical protein [Gammaproteobacteria bacterium]
MDKRRIASPTQRIGIDMLTRIVTILFLAMTTACSPVLETDKPSAASNGKSLIPTKPVIQIGDTSQSNHHRSKPLKFWCLEYELSGGIAGIMERLYLTSDGSLVVYKNNTLVNKGLLDKHTYAAVEQQVVALLARDKDLDAYLGGRTQCRDCITRVVNICQDSVHIQHVEQVEFPKKTPFTDLIKLLSALMLSRSS